MRWGLARALALALALAAAAGAQTYQPCLGCAEHRELTTRWHRPFAIELETESVLIAEHYAAEAKGRRFGLCESNILLRSSTAMNGCHPFSLKRAMLVATPLEILAFTSPAWGLGRAGHTHWALALQAVPMLLHAWAIRHTWEAIHRRQRQIALLQ
ncbi:MAG TPA: hypothetical protein VE996_01555 [Terriglobales bacterium]|jgi:hypothetical protein|nr:hypothetical protein [Terriglobales bacterium]